MSRIRVRIEAYILGLFPQSSGASPGRGQRLRALANGLAVPSFWTSTEITRTFAEANRIWIREADIEFSPISISRRTETVPADDHGMWVHFLNHLRPRGGGVGVGFVFDLPSNEGGWGGGRIAVISGQKARSGLPGLAGNLLAHELGHVLMGDPNHGLARRPSNLMHGVRNPGMANAGILNQRQIDIARRRAQTI
jgi:hypothetical protein